MTSHRGAHPEDEAQFASSQLPTLRAAVHDLAWLRTRGYGDPSSVKLVGNRYQLTRRQRNAVARSACTDAERAHRLVRRRAVNDLAGRSVDVDGFNVLISVEGLLRGAYLFVGRDQAYRDVDPVRGTYRIVAETEPAIRAIREAAKDHRVAGLTWWLDAHVSNVGRLSARLADCAPAGALGWTIRVRNDVDATLRNAENVVITSDSGILDRAAAWCSLEQAVAARLDGALRVRDLRPTSERSGSRSTRGNLRDP